MKKAQIWSIVVAFALFLGLYFGLSARPNKHNKPEQSQITQDEPISIERLSQNAKSAISEAAIKGLTTLEKQLEIATNDAEKVLALKNLSAFWYDNKELTLSGTYAEQVAAIDNADSTWSVAGGTFFTALVSSQDLSIRDYCAKHAIEAFKKAASLAPEKVEHQVNQALVWAENPPPNNPMQAVLMLRDLETKHPENPSVYNALGRLAIKTGQWQKAVERLEKSWSLNKNNSNTPCLLARAYEGLGDNNKAIEFSDICNNNRR